LPADPPHETWKEQGAMATCTICGDELHPERAEKYDYCTKRSCRERAAKGLTIASVGVNKAADQFVVLDERTEQEMAKGRFKKEPEASGAPRSRPRAPRTHTSASIPELVPTTSARPSRPRWSHAQERLALTYRAMGMTPGQIAGKLGVSPYLVTQILLAASGRGKR
jgi:hypothetical protein